MVAATVGGELPTPMDEVDGEVDGEVDSGGRWEARRGSGFRLGPTQREPQREMAAAAMDGCEREVLRWELGARCVWNRPGECG